jgi:hypothetical protein
MWLVISALHRKEREWQWLVNVQGRALQAEQVTSTEALRWARVLAVVEECRGRVG